MFLKGISKVKAYFGGNTPLPEKLLLYGVATFYTI